MRRATSQSSLDGFALTLVGALEPDDLQAARSILQAHGATDLRTTPLTGSPLRAALVRFRGGLDSDALRTELTNRWQARSIGAAVRPAGISSMVPGLWVMDVDSTLIEEEVIDELARVAGRYDEVAAVTARAMNGELDFETALRERCRCLAGLPESVFDEVRSGLHVRPGAARLIRALRAVGCRTAVVSGGFRQTVAPMAAELGIDFVEANSLEVVDGRLTGGLTGAIVDGQRKLAFFHELIAQLGLSPSRTVAVGDGANDVPMLEAAGLGVAFCAKPRVRERAPVTVDLPRLDAVAHHLGWSEDDLADLGGAEA